MNRQQRRASRSQQPSPASGNKKAMQADQLFAEGAWHQEMGRLDEAAQSYKRALAADAEHPASLNNLACIEIAMGQLRSASEHFASLIAASPDLADDFRAIAGSLYAVNPPLGDAVARIRAGEPGIVVAAELLHSSQATETLTDPLLLKLLRATTMRDLALEQLLTGLRTHLLAAATADDASIERLLPFLGALALQCFINEYIFPQTEPETTKVSTLRATIENAESGIAPDEAKLASLACFVSLSTLRNAEQLMRQRWKPAVAELITQQIIEPQKERVLGAGIPALTSIEDSVSLRVRQQYEENPYPRWVAAARARKKTKLNDWLRAHFPKSFTSPVNDANGIEMLVAGCGTGRHPLELADLFPDIRITAVDLSRTSLAYARRKTSPTAAQRITYGQADILKLAELNRSFDAIESVGVLHHMADPFAAWRSLLPLLRPNGVMRIGLYSELARADVVGARSLIADHGFKPTPDDIRRARQALLTSQWSSVAALGDFFSMSECRDLLFHVQEHRVTLPQIKAFIEQEGLRFIGFDLPPELAARSQAAFTSERHEMTDLDAWHAFETREPQSFRRMYQFWVQRT
jgi:2-polyprenyl-3-methyl-5-hydroxy-6-metoxy-1,4-benzoquinol methylase